MRYSSYKIGILEIDIQHANIDYLLAELAKDESEKEVGDERFELVRNALVHHFDFEETPELVEHRKKYPFILTTARQLEHYNAGTMTRRTDNQEISPMDYLEINPLDAAAKNINADDTVRIFSDRGGVEIPVKLTYLVKPGVVRTTFHQPEIFINIITGNVGDEYTLTPEYKVVAVDFERV